MQKCLWGCLVLLFLGCKTGNKAPAAPNTTAKSALELKLEVNTSLFIPDKNQEDGLSCYLVNHTNEIIAVSLDTLFNFFKLYGQGKNQKYPMFLNYQLPPEFRSTDKLYIDPGKSEALFRSPLNQLFFQQLRFVPGESGWMWQSTVKQKADYSPVHDYDVMQKQATLWFDIHLNNKTYSSNRVLISIGSSK